LVKKLSIVLACLLALLIMGCKSVPPDTRVDDPNVPEWLNDFPPEDVLWGIGSARQSSDSMSMTMAEARARQNIANQLNVEVQGMITDYARDAGSINNQASLALAETVGRQITQATLSGVTPLKRWKSPNGTWWYQLQLKKSDAALAAADIIDSEAARYAEFKTMEALKLMDAQLAKKNDKPVPVTE
jgi:glucan-binding YG repeat protein